MNAMAEFNRLCEEAGKQPIGEKNHQLVALLAAGAPPIGVVCRLRVRILDLYQDISIKGYMSNL
eukprot:SAG11_NODE_595_length_8300_cov_38.415437_6_plen_64_part_00